MKEERLRFNQPRGQVKMTSSNSMVLFEAVVTVTGPLPPSLLDLTETTFVESLRLALAKASLATSLRIS